MALKAFMMHGRLLAVLLALLALSVQAEEGCGANFTCTCAAVYGCAPISNSTPANMVCCSDGQQGLKGVAKYCNDTDPTKLPFCPARNVTGHGCIRSLKVGCESAPRVQLDVNTEPPLAQNLI